MVDQDLKQDIRPVCPPMDRITISVNEWCQLTGLGRTLTNRLLHDELLHSIRVFGRRLILATECVDFPRRMSKLNDLPTVN